MKKISLSMGVMCWWEQMSEKYGTNCEKVKHALLAMTFMQTDASMRGLCASSLSDFVDIGWEQLCSLLYLLGKCGLRIEMSREEMDEYEGKAIPKPDTVNWEQRRWELASNCALTVSTGMNGESFFLMPFCDAISWADAFIKEYKKSLNTEE